MTWIFYSILAALFWSSVNIADKVIITKLTKDPVVPMFLLSIVGFIWGVGIVWMQGLPLLTPTQWFFALFGIAVLGIISDIFYFRAMQREEVSRVVPIFYVQAFFVAVIAAVTIGEQFHPVTYLGIVLLVFGAILLSSERITRIRLRAGFWLMLGAALMLSITSVMAKYFLASMSPYQMFALTNIGYFVLFLPWVFAHRFSLKLFYQRYGVSGTIGVTLTQLLSIVGVLFYFLALDQGTATLVSALTSLQPFFVLFSAVVVSHWWPQIYNEVVDAPTVARKFVAMIAMVIGALLVT